MSRIGKKPIPVPKGVQINLMDGRVEVKGPKGQLSQSLPPGVTMALEDGQIVTSVGEAREQRKFHGLGRTNVTRSDRCAEDQEFLGHGCDCCPCRRRYSAATWVPLAAVARFMSRIRSRSERASTDATQKISK